MPLELRLITSPSDLPIAANVIFTSFLQIPLNKASYPHGATPALIASRSSDFLALFNNDPSLRLLKVIDTELNDEIIAVAEWHIYETPEAESQRFDIGRGEKKWENTPDMRGDLFTSFWNRLVEARQRMRGKAHVSKLADTLQSVLLCNMFV